MRLGARSRMALVALGAALAVAVAAAPPVGAEVDGADFESAEWRVRMTAPRNWQVSERASYPNVLLWLSRRSPRGKMLFTAEHLPPGEGPLEYAKRTSAMLTTLGFRVRAPQLHSASGAYWIDAETKDAFLRQAFLVSEGVGYSLTLSAESNRARSQHLRAFDAALRSVRPLKEEGP